MPVSGNFRREMLEAIKNAKKKRDSHDPDDDLAKSPALTLADDNPSKGFGQDCAELTKPLATTRSADIKDDQAKLEKALEKAKSNH